MNRNSPTHRLRDRRALVIGLSSALSLAVISLLSLVVCGCTAESGGNVDGSTRLKVVCTTDMVGEMTSRIAGDSADVRALMPTGVDPHLYKPSESDVSLLRNAQVIFYNGLALEGKMAIVLEKMARTKPVVPVGEAIPEGERRRPLEFDGGYDPHIWFDVRLWTKTLEPIAKTLAANDSKNADGYRERAKALLQDLTSLDAWAEKELARIPKERRVLVTAHDAFGYFGQRYGVEVVAIQGISTAAQAGLRDIERVVKLISERAIPAVFVEASVARRNIEAVQEACAERGHSVAVGGTLYSDSMGAPGTLEGTYRGMVEHNVRTIVKALTAE